MKSTEKHKVPVGCVIMASGLGKRFGSNKLLADFGGQPLISYILNTTSGHLFSERIVVTRHQEVVRLCREKEIPVLYHDLPGRNDTVRLGLEYLAANSRLPIQGCAFCPADQPLLRRETLEALILAFSQNPGSICRPAAISDDSIQPGSPVLFDQCYFPQLLSLPPNKGGAFVVKKYPEQVHYIPVRDSYELCDADTPEALQELSRYVSQ